MPYTFFFVVDIKQKLEKFQKTVLNYYSNSITNENI